MLFKYQFGKHYVKWKKNYEIKPNNLKLSLYDGIVLYLYVAPKFFFYRYFSNKNAILFL